MDPELTLHGAVTMETELSALRKRTDTMRVQAQQALQQARQALSQANELQRRSLRAGDRAAARAQRRLERLASHCPLERPNVVAFDAHATRRRTAESNARKGLDRAA